MVSSITESHASHILGGNSPQPATPSRSTDSFTEQLTSALAGSSAQAGSGSNPQSDVPPAQSQVPGARQFLATVKDPTGADGAGPAATPAAATPSDASATPPDSSTGTFLGFVSASAGASSATPSGEAPPTTFLGFVSVPDNTPSATTTDTSGDASASTSTDATAPATTPMTEDDAYWAAQPPAVQQLRDIPDLADRSALAQQLADQGYTIDKAIMVWGWDPLKTMLTRQMYGYTWAPSMNQDNVSTPGITLPGQTPYDPTNPPPGSIAVNTAFAQGTEITDPWAASQLQAST